jgi:hypothetical protein
MSSSRASSALVVVFRRLHDLVDGAQGEDPLQGVDVFAVLLFQAAQDELHVDWEPALCPSRVIVFFSQSHASGDERGVGEFRVCRRPRHEPLGYAVADGEEFHAILRKSRLLSRIQHRVGPIQVQPGLPARV